MRSLLRTTEDTVNALTTNFLGRRSLLITPDRFDTVFGVEYGRTDIGVHKVLPVDLSGIQEGEEKEKENEVFSSLTLTFLLFFPSPLSPSSSSSLFSATITGLAQNQNPLPPSAISQFHYAKCSFLSPFA
ncbi:hypothetical protein RJT34_11894 [Clitoria ternatea]|uniref:Uncharacterized protein n=1 Tax=Clitoria ternatea TaxID=43366 RepID=A0AAN9PK42_CLITE